MGVVKEILEFCDIDNLSLEGRYLDDSKMRLFWEVLWTWNKRTLCAISAQVLVFIISLGCPA